MPRTHSRRSLLLQLRRVALAIPDDRLHMRTFVERAECGTARCLLGWASADRWFAENTTIRDIVRPMMGPVSDQPLHDAAELFGIGEEDADNLFGSFLRPRETAPHAVTKAEVLWNLDELLAGRPALPYRATRRDVPEYAGGETNVGYRRTGGR